MMPKRILRYALRSFTAPAVRYPPDPRALFILVLCVAVGLPLIFADATPGTIASKLDAAWQIVWGVMLSGGSLLTLMGAVRQSVNGVILEQVGSVALGFACVIYAAAIWATVQWDGSVPIGIVLGFGLASLWRWGQLQAYLNNTERQAQQFREESE
jgi:hypothetical protein